MKELLNEKYHDLDKFIKDNKDNYINANPFPNIVIDDFFCEEFLNDVLNEFPNLSKKQNSDSYVNQNEIKFADNLYSDFPKNIKLLFDFLNSNYFVGFLQKITNINEKLIIDEKLNGGGLHEIKKGGLLKIHSDFNRHPILNLDRRLNVLVYLNKDWNEDYGGHLQLWDKEMQKCEKKILPIFNRMVIFSTTDYSNHGHPDPLNCPDIRSRKSVATYYYSDGRPSNEVDKMYIKNKTYFKNRVGHHNETFQNDTSFKRFLRSFSFYQKIKQFEKKFLRFRLFKKKK